MAKKKPKSKQFISASITINQDESLSLLDCMRISQQICIIFCQSSSDLHHQSDTHDEMNLHKKAPFDAAALHNQNELQ